MEKGFFITSDIAHCKELTLAEKVILAIYRTYTKFGKKKCCILTKEQIAEEFDISTETVKRARKKLKELGYIKTNGGNTVWYVGVNKISKKSHKMFEQTQNVPPKVIQNVEQGDTKCISLGVSKCAHNINNKKNIKNLNTETVDTKCSPNTDFEVEDWLNTIDIDEVYSVY